MGKLSPEETREVDALRKEHPEVNSEIQRIEDAMLAYADSHAIKPASEMKDKIAKQLQFAVSLDLENEMVDSILIQMPGIYKLAAAASVALIIAFAGTTYYFGSRYRDSQNEIASLKAEKKQTALTLQKTAASTEQLKTELAVALQPNFKKLVLTGQKIAPEARATVYWNEKTGATYISAKTMPAVTGQKQYQLWAMYNNKPVSLGVIPVDGDFTAMKDIQHPSAFCITLEPMGGSETPTLDQLYATVNI